MPTSVKQTLKKEKEKIINKLRKGILYKRQQLDFIPGHQLGAFLRLQRNIALFFFKDILALAVVIHVKNIRYCIKENPMFKLIPISKLIKPTNLSLL